MEIRMTLLFKCCSAAGIQSKHSPFPGCRGDRRTRQNSEVIALVKHPYLHAEDWKLCFFDSDWPWCGTVQFILKWLEKKSLWFSRKAAEHSVCWPLQAMAAVLCITAVHIEPAFKCFALFVFIKNVCVHCVSVTMEAQLMPKLVYSIHIPMKNQIFVCPVCPNVIKKCCQTGNATRADIKQGLEILLSHNCFNSLSCVSEIKDTEPPTWSRGTVTRVVKIWQVSGHDKETDLIIAMYHVTTILLWTFQSANAHRTDLSCQYRVL